MKKHKQHRHMLLLDCPISVLHSSILPFLTLHEAHAMLPCTSATLKQIVDTRHRVTQIMRITGNYFPPPVFWQTWGPRVERLCYEESSMDLPLLVEHVSVMQAIEELLVVQVTIHQLSDLVQLLDSIPAIAKLRYLYVDLFRIHRMSGSMCVIKSNTLERLHIDSIYHTCQIWRTDDLKLGSLPNLRDVEIGDHFDVSIGDAFLGCPKLENFKSPVHTLRIEAIQSLHMSALKTMELRILSPKSVNQLFSELPRLCPVLRNLVIMDATQVSVPTLEFVGRFGPEMNMVAVYMDYDGHGDDDYDRPIPWVVDDSLQTKKFTVKTGYNCVCFERRLG